MRVCAVVLRLSSGNQQARRKPSFSAVFPLGSSINYVSTNFLYFWHPSLPFQHFYTYPLTFSLIFNPPLRVLGNGFMRAFLTTTKYYNKIIHVWSQFYKNQVVLKYHRGPWANILDTDIFWSINIPKKAKYTTLM